MLNALLANQKVGAAIRHRDTFGNISSFTFKTRFGKILREKIESQGYPPGITDDA
jgi:hypothetical protein